MEYYHRIKEVRLRSNMTQKQLADATGIAPGSLSAYEKGAKTPPVDVAYRIAQALSVSLDWLFNYELSEKEVQFLIRSYGDAARLIINLAIMQQEKAKIFAFNPNSSHCNDKTSSGEIEKEKLKIFCDGEYYTLLMIKGEILSRFFEDFTELYNLCIAGTVKKEVLDTWLQAKYALLDQIPLSSM